MTESDFKRIAEVIGPVSGATHEALREYFVNGNIKAAAAKLAGIKPSTMTIYVANVGQLIPALSRTALPVIHVVISVGAKQILHGNDIDIGNPKQIIKTCESLIRIFTNYEIEDPNHSRQSKPTFELWRDLVDLHTVKIALGNISAKASASMFNELKTVWNLTKKQRQERRQAIAQANTNAIKLYFTGEGAKGRRLAFVRASLWRSVVWMANY
eukprot:gene26881-29557_t